MEVNFEQLLQQSNQIKNYIQSEVLPLPDDVLNRKKTEKNWSALEVVDHLNKVYDIYLPLFTQALTGAPELGDYSASKKQSTLLGRLSIYSMRPKGAKRKFKMKTFDFFRPSEHTKKETIETFLKNKETYNQLIKQARTKNLTGIKMPTSLGKRVKFYVPECFEFILAHEQRHMVQIAEAVE
ncbi:MAG: DinB family protein [Ekhidna sp.]|uniref:DinB family protein n=1 Tax=Ekhidna sp. TaxID=2608089 RepID=UPI0032EECD24